MVENFEDIQTSEIRKAYVRVDPTVMGRAYYRTNRAHVGAWAELEIHTIQLPSSAPSFFFNAIHSAQYYGKRQSYLIQSSLQHTTISVNMQYPSKIWSLRRNELRIRDSVCISADLQGLAPP